MIYLKLALQSQKIIQNVLTNQNLELNTDMSLTLIIHIHKQFAIGLGLLLHKILIRWQYIFVGFNVHLHYSV